MKVGEYAEFVRRTDQSVTRKPADRKSIAYYGLIGEIGSVISAVKKKLLKEGGEKSWDQPNEEIIDELGDVLWYCFSTANVVNSKPVDILAKDISALRDEIGAKDKRAERIRAVLNPAARKAFLAEAKAFPPTPSYTFDDYQQIAYKTARTKGRTLLEVCLAVLSQLGAELLRATLPKIERTLNKNIADRDPNVVLGEISWHLSAIASLYHLSLNEVIKANQAKVSYRTPKGPPTPLHDEGRSAHEQFPRVFDIAFVSIGYRKSRMYFEGRRLGNDLTDNNTQDDGYRFHDVLHLAFVAHLGWSPVLRGFMKRKRPDVDDVQDGGRAKIVEELVIKAIHSEGERQARDPARCAIEGPVRHFPDRASIPFSLLKTIRGWVEVERSEVGTNMFWEWENAIYDGHEIFFQLRQHKQGTVRVDMNSRKVSFRPTVSPDITGMTIGIGMGVSEHEDIPTEILSKAERAVARSDLARTFASKKALFQALGLPLETLWNELELQVVDNSQISVRATGAVQQRIWELRAVDFKVAFATAGGAIVATVVAIADVTD
jgi:NTP pyrophosphatase (non-canonical NTP hydrolase)/phosphopantetheinyl transferase (holo-ACP synthase)